MSLVGHLDVGRSDRVAVDRAGTLRDRERAPVDVVVDNLSTTGCLFVFDRDLPLGALVSIGIPGVGVRYARISRVDHPRYACAFLTPVTPEDVAAALSVETLVKGAFPHMPAPARPTGTAAKPDRKLPLRTRTVTIIGLCAILWAAIIAAVVATAL